MITMNQKEEERRRLTLEALEEADAGDVVSHREVQAWAARLGSASPLPLPTSAKRSK
jgi:predicted transcriptional regulator